MLEVVYHLHTQNILSLECLMLPCVVCLYHLMHCTVSSSTLSPTLSPTDLDSKVRSQNISLTSLFNITSLVKQPPMLSSSISSCHLSVLLNLYCLVSDAIAMQREWSFAKTCRLLTSLFRKLAVIFKVEELLSHLQQVLETHEVNWQHVLSCLSTLLVYNPNTQPSLKELLSRLLSSAFEGYDLENMITAFLLARQGALEGPGVFPSYSEWFKMSFGGASSYHGKSKKSLVFLLKFLSDLVPFDPPQYLKVHILHPPYVAVKHRALLQEYVSLTKTRLADLKVSIEEMGLYEDISGAGTSVQPRCQARQDVEKAISLFGSTGRISATVMEASIFRRPYFLSRFLPALLTPRVLPVKPDARMNFIDSLKKYFLTFTLSHTTTHHTVFCHIFEADRCFLYIDSSFVFCSLLERKRSQLPHKTALLSFEFNVTCDPRQSPWASQFVNILLGHRQLLTALLHRMWDLLHNQGVSLSAAHVLGLAAFVVHLHASQTKCPKVQLCPPLLPGPVSVLEALTTALPCTTQTNMLFCVRWLYLSACLHRSMSCLFLCVCVCVFYMRRLPIEASGESEYVGANKQGEEENCGLWKSVTDTNTTWRKSAWALWKHAPFCLLVKLPEYQFSFSEWLAAELRVQRSEDALSDPDRQEYQQWACQQLYLPSPVDKGGCAGDLKTACSHILNAVMDQKTVWSEIVYEMELTSRSQRTQDKGHFLLDLISHRCSVTSDLQSISSELCIQQTLHTWNR
uniref:Fanconi anaemia group A protein N-terminal domain-containing protein n=1 Tax=Oncorhynchus kisutch TaxID=8019 RepID=A0A8C7L3Q2_ONCKI